MKKFNRNNHVSLIVALVCPAFLASEMSGAATRERPGTNPGRLIIRRSPNLGGGLFLSVSIDGAKVADLSYGQSFERAISPGQHVLSVMVRPNQLFLTPTQKTLTVESGKTYALTAMWQGQTVVLR
jgi:hypothetical protein